MLFSSINLPYWIFLGAGITLFLFVIVSGGSDDDLDADVDADVDADLDFDVDADVDVDVDADVGGDSFWGIDGDGEGLSPLQILAWFGVGRTPLLLLLAMDLTLWGFMGWVLNVALGDVLNQPPVGLLALGVFGGSLIFALMVGSLLSQPIGRIFAAFGEDASSDRLVGCLGTVTSAFIPLEESGKIGQVDVKDAACNLVTISAKLPTWATITLRRGARVIVIERQGGYYLVIGQDTVDQARWLEEG
ncbi:OB-fold-containig protein [Leptolyngbya sp. PCC 6406]|uniref:OB-fold-containig protein n=1 Tax=Leptolyngbya sp. PCC 6406 TaxID=1173264 RepID=UPI0002AC04E7|nr:OB-fold-containig protein [Leptolyngbya sp. PCC 6406]